MLDTAIQNLHKCLWFGNMEKLDKSLELLKYQTGLDLKYPIINKTPHTKPPIQIVRQLQFLMPMDLYFYKYANELFEQRWKWYVENVKQNKTEMEMLCGGDFSKVSSPVVNGCISAKAKIQGPNKPRVSSFTDDA